VTRGGRSQRAAASLATSRMRNQNSGRDSFGESNDYTSSATMTTWDCPVCSIANELRARSCITCGERKPTTAALEAAFRAAHRKPIEQRPKRKVVKKYHSSDEESSDEDEGESGEDDDDEEEEGHGIESRVSNRKRTNISYGEDSGSDGEGNKRDINTRPKKQQNQQREAPVSMESDESFFATYQRNLPAKIAKFTNYIDRQQNRLVDGVSGELAAAVDLNIRCLSILRKLLCSARTQPFWEPVDTKQVPSYK
jgi:hypothetical protein